MRVHNNKKKYRCALTLLCNLRLHRLLLQRQLGLEHRKEKR